MTTNVTEKQPKTSNRRRLFDTPISAQLRISVIVPVRNEAHHLTQTLDALRQQQRPNGEPVPSFSYEVLLLANNCTDRSYDVALRYSQRYPHFPLRIAQIQLPPSQANIGTVRRLLMNEACRRLMSVGDAGGIIASTDGDTVVDKHWLHYIGTEITQGCDAVGGRILTHPNDNPVRLFHLRDVMYRSLIARAEALIDPCVHDPWPRHFQHFGASIAVTCAAYQRAGGLPAKPFLEDEAFYRALLRVDAKVRQSPHVRVYTSARMKGRVAVGFSEQLRYWSNMNRSQQCQLVESAEAIVTRLSARQALRSYWHRRGERSASVDELNHIAKTLLISPQWLSNEVDAHAYFGQLWEKIEKKIATGRWAKLWGPVPITDAIRDLRTYVNEGRYVPTRQPKPVFTASRTSQAGTYRPVGQAGG